MLVPEQKLLRLFIGLAHKVDSRTSDKMLVPEQKLLRLFIGLAHKLDSRTSDKMLVPEQKLLRNLLVWHTRYQDNSSASTSRAQ